MFPSRLAGSVVVVPRRSAAYVREVAQSVRQRLSRGEAAAQEVDAFARSNPKPFDPFTSRDVAGPGDQVPLDLQLLKSQPLKGKRVVVLVESQFVPQELALYAERFKAYGADVEFASHLWGQKSLEFHSRIDRDIVPELRTMVVSKDIGDIDLGKGSDVAAVIQSVHTQQRLLYDPGIAQSTDPIAATAKAPAIQFLSRALDNPGIVVGAFGHGAEVLAPLGRQIRGARMTTSPGSAVHISNAGAQFVPPADPTKWTTHVVTEPRDGLNLVTAMSILHGGNQAFVDAIARRAGELRRALPR